MSTVSGVPLCYYPSGDIATSDYACNLSTEASFCCARGYACLENNVCENTVNNDTHLWNRGSCTDESWSSQACPQFCRNFHPARGNWIVQCEPTTNPGRVCCYDWEAEAPDACCTNSSAIIFTIPGATTAFRTIDLAAATATRSLSSSSPAITSSGPSTLATGTPESTSRPSSGTIAAGVVVGGAVAGIALFMVLAWYWFRRMRQNKRTHLQMNHDELLSKAPADKAAMLSRAAVEMENKSLAEVSSEQILVELDTRATTHELAGSEALNTSK